jgi:hypothetical protein
VDYLSGFGNLAVRRYAAVEVLDAYDRALEHAQRLPDAAGRDGATLDVVLRKCAPLMLLGGYAKIPPLFGPYAC